MIWEPRSTFFFTGFSGVGCGQSGHVNASHGLGSDIFTGFGSNCYTIFETFSFVFRNRSTRTQYAINNNSNKLRVSILSCVQV